MGRTPLRDVLVVMGAWALLATAFTVLTAAALITLRIGADRWFPPVGRVIARGVLRIAGVRVVLRGGERLAGRRPRILALNHTSQLDLFVVGSVFPPGATAIAKKEFFWVPFLGWGFFAFRFIFVDRGDPARARRSIARAAARVVARRATVCIAPEGTRSRTGGLGPFKMGAFHLAFASRAPIVPMVIRGCAALQPMGSWVPRAGVVTVDVLPEIPTDGWTEDELHARRDALRDLFAAALAEAGPDPGLSG